MDESFASEYSDMLRKIACFIGYSLERVFRRQVSAQLEFKTHLANFAFAIFSELVEDREAQSATNDVLQSFLFNLKLNSDFSLKGT